MAKTSRGKTSQTLRRSLPLAPRTKNEQAPMQRRKILGRHYAAKYRVR